MNLFSTSFYHNLIILSCKLLLSKRIDQIEENNNNFIKFNNEFKNQINGHFLSIFQGLSFSHTFPECKERRFSVYLQ